jgi:hypothetical protein
VDVVGGSTAEGWAEVGAALVDGVNVDAVAASVAACPSVARLVAGAPAGVVTYLPVGKEPAFGSSRIGSQSRYAACGTSRSRRLR